jgi:hypothetical protein
MKDAEELLVSTGLSHAEAKLLHDGGFRAFAMEELSEEERLHVGRSEPANIFGPTMSVDSYRPAGRGLASRYVFVDSFTGGIFTPVKLTDCALYGRSGFREKLPTSLEPSGWARARFQEIPYFEVNDVASLEELATALSNENSKTFFRGQTGDYCVPRAPEVISLLYGNSNTREPSLLSTAARSKFNYVAHEPAIQLLFDDIRYRAGGSYSRTHWVEDRFEHVYISDVGGIAARASARTMALAQHYGVPTHGLDVTRSLRTAWWFATHDFNGGAYSQHQTPPGAPLHDLPVIYVLRSQHVVDLDDLDLHATRPTAQDAIFIHGSWGMHSNVCAEDLLAIIILGAGMPVCDTSKEALFPTASNDLFYAEMLEFKRTLDDVRFKEPLAHIYEVVF